MRKWLSFTLIFCSLSAYSQSPPSTPDHAPVFSQDELLLPQVLPVFPSDPAKEIKFLAGTVVRYYRFVMWNTSNGDLILKANGTNSFVHLVYSPFDFGFDAPAASESQLMPRQMIADGTLEWTFHVHLPLNGRELGVCKPLPKEVKGPDGKPLQIDRNLYSPMAGQEGAKLPPIETLQCFVVVSWSKGISNANDTTINNASAPN